MSEKSVTLPKAGTFRMISVSGTFDRQGTKDELIRLASKKRGMFVLWVWEMNIWNRVESFCF